MVTALVNQNYNVSVNIIEPSNITTPGSYSPVWIPTFVEEKIEGEILIDKNFITTETLFTIKTVNGTRMVCDNILLTSNISKDVTIDLSLSPLYSLQNCKGLLDITYVEVTNKCQIVKNDSLTSANLIKKSVFLKSGQSKSVNVCINLKESETVEQFYQGLIMSYEGKSKIVDMVLSSSRFKKKQIITLTSMFVSAFLLIIILLNQESINLFLRRPI